MATPKMLTEFLSQLQGRMQEARAQTDALFALLRAEAIYERPIPERHRLIFYLGHLEAFDWNLLGRDTFGLESANARFDKLFAFGIDPVDGQLPSDQSTDWPSVEAIRAYNAELRARIDEAVRGAGNRRTVSITDGTALDVLLNVAIEHRLMHAETLAYLLHQLPYEQKVRPRAFATAATRSVAQQMKDIPEGEATLGMRRDSGKFGWDNEFEEQKVFVPRFRIGAYPVTNGEYLEFVRKGGYEERANWSEDDWKWMCAARIANPSFWERDGEDWEYRGMFARVPLPLDWPVYVSHAEASAYARWARQSLPSETQWHRAAYGGRAGATEALYPWGDEEPSRARGNFNFEQWDPTPVNAHPSGQSVFGVHDLVGNGWEWTSTPLAPLPGFQAFSFYPGYSANFFDGRHFVMKGGSQRTGACMLRRAFRNWFQPHYPYAYAKFRTVEE